MFLISEPIFNEVKKLRSSVQFTGAIYQAPVHNVCGDVVVWQLNSPLSMEVDLKSQLQRSLMAAVRAVLTAQSAR